ncbi:MAG: TonB-dependent siderophore receptor, partial [Spirochaetota bacterium]
AGKVIPPPRGTTEECIATPLERVSNETVIKGDLDRQDAYIRTEANGVTKSDVKLMDTPQSVQVVPNQVISDQKVFSMGEAARNVSNVTYGTNSAFGYGDGLLMRGFQAPLLMIDGMPNWSGAAGLGPREVFQYSRVEVLKGPSSMTFGSIEPGGALNMVTKKPLGKDYYEFEVGGGTFNQYYATADLTGPLNKDKTLLYRLLAVGRKGDSFRDTVNTERGFFAPSFDWLIGANTTLSVFGHYQKDYIRQDRGVPALADDSNTFLRNQYTTEAPQLVQQARSARQVFPIGYRLDDRIYNTRYFGNRELESDDQVQNSFGYEVVHEFSDNWNLRHRTRGEAVNVHTRRTVPNPANATVLPLSGLAEDNRTLNRQFEERTSKLSTYNTQLVLAGKIKTEGMVHRPTLGVDFNHAAIGIRIENNFFDAGTKDVFLTDEEQQIVNTLTISGYQPDANVFFADKPVTPSSVNPFNIKIRGNIDFAGVYGQYHLELGDNWRFLVGARYDRVRGKSQDENFTLRRILSLFSSAVATTLYTNPEISRISADYISPRGGVLYRPVKWLSVFASAADNFTQDLTALQGARNTPKPTVSRSYEGGFKLQFFRNRLNATATGFEIRKKNIVAPDPLNANRLIQTGEQLHRGGEFDILATPVKGLNLIAGVGYLEAVISHDETLDPANNQKLLEGNRPANVPEWTANGWIVYEFQKSVVRGLGLGMGGNYISWRYATNTNDLVLPQYTVANGMVYYKFSRGKFAINVKNIYNKRYMLFGNRVDQVLPGRPFEAFFSLNIRI